MTDAFIPTKSCKQSKLNTSTNTHHYSTDTISTKSDLNRTALDTCRRLIQKQGIHSNIIMNSAGFHYTNKGDEARCDTCGLEVSGWTLDMEPFNIHAQRSPTCAFVRSIQPAERIAGPSTITVPINTAKSSSDEVPFKRQKTETTQENIQPNILVEVNMLKQIRNRTFSHWPRQASPSSAQLIEAGFFACNVGDRVICLYCDIICQQWTPNTDNPSEIHKILSPTCPYVLSMSARSQTSSIPIINKHSPRDNSTTITDNNLFQHDLIVTTAACHVSYVEIPKRYASFTTWSSDNSPSVDDLVRAGFFFTGTKTIVTCFYCNGSLQNWSATDNPTTEHAQWFPHCLYAKQLCGAEQYREIQELNRRRKGMSNHLHQKIE
jgi:baculoviral IAP repeat-containing protein 1